MVSGQVELFPVQVRRNNPRYGGADAAMMGPPAPFVGVVYLTKETPFEFTPAAEPYVLAQKGLQFYPSVLAVERGARVTFPNSDNTYHNVFSYSPEKRFDLGRYINDVDPPIVTFDEPGQIRVFCEVHEHMRAVILVLETPYFTATDEAGNFELKGVPAGTYTLNIWRINRPLEQRPLTVSEAAVTIE